MFLISVPCLAADIPESLKPWEGWVLHNEEENVCPPVFNNGNDHRCYWPTELLLDLDGAGGRFDLNVTLYAESWVSLPGGPKSWPQKVSVKGTPHTVTLNQGRPALLLPTGQYSIRGEFT
ncbi:MAG: hypothetical protein P1S59_03160 [bacterium]|nr:hypothetical protein [bacterium]